MFVNSTESKHSSFHEILSGDIIHTTTSQNHCSTCVNDLLASFLENFTFLESDLLEIFRIINEDLNTHLHAEFIEIKVNNSDLSLINSSFHLLASSLSLEDVSLDHLRLHRALTMTLDDLNILNRIF